MSECKGFGYNDTFAFLKDCITEIEKERDDLKAKLAAVRAVAEKLRKYLNGVDPREEPAIVQGEYKAFRRSLEMIEEALK